MPAEDVLIGGEDVGESVAVEVDEAQVGVGPVDVRRRWEGPEWHPLAVVSLEGPLRFPAYPDQVEQAVGVDVLELEPVGQGGAGTRFDPGHPAEVSVAGVVAAGGLLVEPPAAGGPALSTPGRPSPS